MHVYLCKITGLDILYFMKKKPVHIFIISTKIDETLFLPSLFFSTHYLDDFLKLNIETTYTGIQTGNCCYSSVKVRVAGPVDLESFLVNLVY